MESTDFAGRINSQSFGVAMMDLNPVSDERAILNGLGLFARLVDRREWTRISEVFSEDVVFDYGDGRDQRGVETLTGIFRHFLDQCGPSQHLLGSTQVELDGDHVVTRSYVQARHQGKDEKTHLFLDTNGEYVDRWERRRSGWRIVRRDVRWFTMSGDLSVLFPSSEHLSAPEQLAPLN